MGQKTQISWADATWNPWRGCSRVSPGCTNCYAAREMSRYGKDFDTVTRSKTTFKDPLKWREPKRIFTCSWSDFFIEDADPWREEAWEIMLEANWHTYIILTKRPGLMEDWARRHPWPDHIWAGASVESQKYAPRLTVLARVPAKVRVVSCEPLLEPLYLYRWLASHYHCQWDCEHPQPFVKDSIYVCGRCWFKDGITSPMIPCVPGICDDPPESVLDWAIVGGESGPNFRPMEISWLTDIVDQCNAAGVPVWVKQDSGLHPGRQGRIPDRYWIQELP